MRVFLSYSHSDAEFAQRLELALVEHGLEVLVDEKLISVGDSISERIGEAIEQSSYFCLLLSPTSVGSPWVRREYATALTIQLSKPPNELRIMPVLLANTEIPILLRDIRYADFSQDFSLGLSNLLTAMGVPVSPAPFSGVYNLFSRPNGDARVEFLRSSQSNHAHFFTELWFNIIESATLLLRELEAEAAIHSYPLLARSAIEAHFRASGASRARIGLPEVIMISELVPSPKFPPGSTYAEFKLICGVKDLLGIYQDYHAQIRRRQLWVIPNAVRWEAVGDAKYSGRISFADHLK